MEINTYKRNAIESIDSMAAFYEEIANCIWETPELSLQEFESCNRYCSALRSLGFEVKENLCGIKTAFSGSYGQGKPVIGILAEYDALSGLSQQANIDTELPIIEGGNGHGCGHNLLGAGSLAAAAAIKHYLEETGREGTVILFGCPGEEGGAAKAFMAREKMWEQLDAALSWHPSDVNQIKTGTNNSSIQVLYKFHGIPAHAAGDPYNGRSALDAVELMNIGVQFLREHMTDDCRVHYAITETGGISPNVVQSRASVLYMVRANKVADSVKLQARVDDIAKGAALMTGTTYERVFIDGTAELLPNYTIEKVLYDNFLQIGAPVFDEEDMAQAEALRATYPQTRIVPGIGPKHDKDIERQVKKLTGNMSKTFNDFVMPFFSGTVFSAGSSDVGDVSWQTPTSQIEVSTWPSGIPHHSWQVVSCGKSSFAHKGMLCAGKVLAATAIDLMENEELLAAAKAEFEEKSEAGYVCPIEPDAVPTVI